MINGDHITNFLYILLAGFMFAVVIIAGMSAIDKVAERDCARGITSACQYVPTTK